MKKILALFAISALVAAPVSARPGNAFTAQEETLTRALAALASFTPGTDDAVLLQFQNLMRSRFRDPGARPECEAALLVFLQGEATLPGKMAVCRELRIIGSDKSVPLLEKMLASGDTTDMARYALEGIPGDAAGAALVRALAVLKGDGKLGVISSLAHMKYAGGAQSLASSLTSAEDSEAVAAAAALGKIGGDISISALTAALGSAPSAGRREMAASGLLVCAERLIAARDNSRVSEIAAKVGAARVSPAIRRAAVKAGIVAAGPAAPDKILAILGGKQPEMLQPAIDLVPSVFDGKSIARVLGLLPGLPENAQIQLISLLDRFPAAAVRPTLLDAAGGSPMPAVRIASVRTLAAVGDKSCVALLVERAARTAGAEQAAARETLARVRGEDVDGAIRNKLAEIKDTAVLGELIRAAGERGIPESVGILMKISGSDNAMIRIQALRAIRKLARAEDITPLLTMLMEAQDETDIEEIAGTVAAVASREAKPNDRAGAAASLISVERDPKRKASLLLVIGKIGEDNTLPVARRALSEDDPMARGAAARAIAAWPTPAARDDALTLARTSKDPVMRVLALQGFIRMIGLERYRAPEGAVASLGDALAAAERPEEKKMILGLLPGFACLEALRMAESLQASPEVGAEARAAVAGIKERLPEKAP